MTKAFNFPLQKVLDVRTMIEDAKAIELQKAQAETEREKQSLNQIKAEKDALINTSDNAQESVSLMSLNQRTAYSEQLDDKIEEQNQIIEKSEQETEEQRQAFVQASKDKMVIEKLKENHKDAFKKKANQDQVKNESEVAARISQNEGGL